MYADGNKYQGRISAVGALDTLAGKTVLRVNVTGEHGVLPGVLWLDPHDGKTVNGNKLPSSLERAKSLCLYLTGKTFAPDTLPLMGLSHKAVDFTAKSRTTNNGATVFDAQYIQEPFGLAATKAPTEAQLALVFGNTTPAPSQDKPRDFRRVENPDAEPPTDNDIPFDLPT